MQEESQIGLEIDPYFSQSKTQNTHKKAEWSVIGTQIHYAQHPHIREGLLMNQCEEKIESQVMGKMENPNLLSLEVESKQIKDVFTDRFNALVHYLHATEKFIDSRDSSTTYLGVDNLSLRDYHVAECSFQIYSNSYTWGQIVGGTPIDMVIDSGASKCYISKAFYDKNPSLHKLPKYKTNIQGLRLGNGEFVPAPFLIPVVFKVVKHKFEILALVSDIKCRTDLVFGVKNMFEVEGELSCREPQFRFLNRAVPLFCLENFSLKPGCKTYVKMSVPFIEKLNGIS